jgi:peptidoglycan/xylan/chitin deacetylase (PgdA/CDA1 family)
MLRVTERASIVSGGATELKLGPRALYPAKAAVTRARSLAWLVRRRRGTWDGGLRTLFYHRVALGSDELSVTPAAFASQMQWLAAHGFRAVDLVTFAALLDGGAHGQVIGLSFDDAYLDVAEQAEPVLAELGFTASVFVSTGVTDGRARFTWYRDQPPLIGWEEMRRLDGGALRFEAHTVTHPNLRALPDEEARREIAEGKAELEERLGRPVRAFCYPGGVFGERDRRLVAEAGFEVAASCEPGVNDASTDRLALRRIQVDHRDALVDVRAKALGGHDAPLPLRAIYRRLRLASSDS